MIQFAVPSGIRMTYQLAWILSPPSWRLICYFLLSDSGERLTDYAAVYEPCIKTGMFAAQFVNIVALTLGLSK
jgi:hypothetical protein